MTVMPVVLWTDALVFLLLATIAGGGWYAWRRPHLREPWQRVVRSRPGMAALVVLCAYVVIGVLDSLHFRLPLENAAPTQKEAHYSGEVLSVLDALVGPLRERVEKTYSAPLAMQLYAKETIDLPDGGQARVYPRLQYGGAHLADPAQRDADVMKLTLLGLTKGVLVALAVSVLMVWQLARRHQRRWGDMARAVMRGRTDIPWHVLLLTLTVLLLVLFWCIELSAKYHVLGTDKVGQDVLYQALKSVRTGLVIGTLTTLVMLPFAVLLGIVAGYLRGWVDDVVQYLYTTLSSIPGVLLIAAAVLMVQVYISTHPDVFDTDAARADIRLLFLCIILGITSWTGLCRLLRGEAMKLREMDYIQAAQAFGVGHFSIITRHILPNVMHIVMISVVLDFSGLVLAEAVLSYVGVGVDPTMHSWGNMINGARLEMAREPMVWWSLLAAFLFMFVLVLAANFFSDAVRDAFDPRLRK